MYYNTKIVIGSDEGAYAPGAGARTIALSEISFIPKIEQLAYLYNKTQDVLYYAPAEGLAECTIAGLVITIDTFFAVLGGGDELHIQFWKEPSPARGIGNYSTARGDFTAVMTAATKNVTITGLPFTLANKHVVSVERTDASDNTVYLPLTKMSVAGDVITLSDAADFTAGDVVEVELIGPDKAYDPALDSGLNTVLNPEYNHYTSVEHLISESDLGITDSATGTDADTLTDTNHTATALDFDAEQVAVGFEAYSETTDETGTVNTITDGDNIETGAITNWTSDVYWLPECKRFVIPAEGYNFMTIHARLSTDDATNVAYMKLYSTLDENADDTDDTYWVDISTDVFGAATISATNGSTEGIYFIDTPTVVLKYCIKIVAEIISGTGSAAASNDYDIYIKKSS